MFHLEINLIIMHNGNVIFKKFNFGKIFKKFFFKSNFFSISNLLILRIITPIFLSVKSNNLSVGKGK